MQIISFLVISAALFLSASWKKSTIINLTKAFSALQLHSLILDFCFLFSFFDLWHVHVQTEIKGFLLVHER